MWNCINIRGSLITVPRLTTISNLAKISIKPSLLRSLRQRKLLYSLDMLFATVIPLSYLKSLYIYTQYTVYRVCYVTRVTFLLSAGMWQEMFCTLSVSSIRSTMRKDPKMLCFHSRLRSNEKRQYMVLLMLPKVSLALFWKTYWPSRCAGTVS